MGEKEDVEIEGDRMRDKSGSMEISSGMEVQCCRQEA